jgi:hypothetical protein
MLVNERRMKKNKQTRKELAAFAIRATPRQARVGAVAPREEVARVGVIGKAAFEHNLPQGSGSGFADVLGKNPEGESESRL